MQRAEGRGYTHREHGSQVVKLIDVFDQTRARPSDEIVFTAWEEKKKKKKEGIHLYSTGTNTALAPIQTSLFFSPQMVLNDTDFCLRNFFIRIWKQVVG